MSLFIVLFGNKKVAERAPKARVSRRRRRRGVWYGRGVPLPTWEGYVEGAVQ